jgi:hypothetical protein
MLTFKQYLEEAPHPENPPVKYDYYKSIKKYTHPGKSSSSKGGGAGGGNGGGSGDGGA